MRDYRIRSRVGEKLPWLLYRGRPEASAKDYKHFSRVMCTHTASCIDRQLQSKLTFLTFEDLMEYVPDSAGDLGSGKRKSTKNIMFM